MRKALESKLDAEHKRHEVILLAIVAERLEDFRKEWQSTRKTGVKITFGMGTMSAEGKNLDCYYGTGWPRILKELDRDLGDITNQYCAACPDDFVVE